MMQPDILDSVAGELIGIISENQAAAIVRRLRAQWGGDVAYVHRIDRQARDSAIKKELSAGHSVNAVAHRLNCSRESVRRIKAAN